MDHLVRFVQRSPLGALCKRVAERELKLAGVSCFVCEMICGLVFSADVARVLVDVAINADDTLDHFHPVRIRLMPVFSCERFLKLDCR